MTTDDIKDAVVRILGTIAPEARGQALVANQTLRDQVDLDSMDVLNFVIALHEEFAVDIPEADYGALTTLDGIAEYLARRLDSKARG